VNRELMRTVRQRAGDRCEYCHMPNWALPLPFQIDHIVAEKHGGQTVEDNLALACPHCNRFGRTAIDRTAVQVLTMNADDLLLVRAELLQEAGID
jgi:5-methylcytosine-specific restriction endonuclease McrA